MQATSDELIACFKQASTVEEKDFWSSLLQLKNNEFRLKSMYATSELSSVNVPEDILDFHNKKYKIYKVDDHFFLMTNDGWNRVLGTYNTKKELMSNLDKIIKDYEDKINI